MFKEDKLKVPCAQKLFIMQCKTVESETENGQFLKIKKHKKSFDDWFQDKQWGSVMCVHTWCSDPNHSRFNFLVYQLRKRKKRFKNSHIFQQTIKWKNKAGFESRWHLPAMRVLDESYPKTKTSKHLIRPKLDKYIFKKQKITKLRMNPIKPDLNKSTFTSLDVHWIRYKTSS